MSVTNIRRNGPVVRRSLQTAHDGIDLAIAEGAGLLMTAVRTRVSTAMDGAVGQRQIELMLDGLGQLRDARAVFIDVHEGLRRIGIDHNIVAEGDWPPKIEPAADVASITAAA